MTTQMKNDLDRTQYPTPQAILDAQDLGREKKIALLKQWDYDLRLILVASEENMTRADDVKSGDGGPAERLRDVHAALEKLEPGITQPQEDGVPHKAGETPQ